MTTLKTSELTGAALDWAVAKCEGLPFTHGDYEYSLDGRVFQRGGCSVERRYSTDWAQGGPIIEREKIELRYHDVIVAGIWYRDGIGSDECSHKAIGPTPLIAAMRCYVVSKLGEEVEIPEGFK